MGRYGDELPGQRQEQCQHLVHILIRHDAEQEHELLPRKAVPQALHSGPHSVGVVAAIQQKDGRMPQQLESARPAHLFQTGTDGTALHVLLPGNALRMALSGMFQPWVRITRRAVTASAAFRGW